MSARFDVSHGSQRRLVLVGALLVSGWLASCSPYSFSDDVQALSTKMTSIDASSQDTAQRIVAEKHLYNRLKWIRDKPILAATAGCDPNAPAKDICDLMIDTHMNPPAYPMPTPQPVAPRTKVCEPTPIPVPTPTKETVGALPPLDRAALPKSLDTYFAALAAITKAQDRADLDSAAASASAAVGGLAQSGATASGVAAAGGPLAGNLATASSNAALWLLGQELDYRRLQQLRIATQGACEPVHTLAAAMTILLEEQREVRLQGMSKLLGLKLQAVGRARQDPHVTDAAYGTMLDEAQAAADAYQAIKVVNPSKLMQALIDTHDQLVVAVRNNDGEFTQLVMSLTALGKNTNDLANAAATSAPAPSTAAKSP
ncbi:MAG: hypothetical protein P4L90_29535 [Rhodopila sp.]|nr:hypothetical protein [Rhodopila sp.]